MIANLQMYIDFQNQSRTILIIPIQNDNLIMQQRKNLQHKRCAIEDV